MTRAELAPEVRDLWRRVYAATCSTSATGVHEQDYLLRLAVNRADRAVIEYLKRFGDDRAETEGLNEWRFSFANPDDWKEE